ncbi:hypothetical protein [Nodosilinea nodulosa]|uniref:hypothetical protein n=1 Tax=Nodosilinea nodulosa TaxID=416001 RepID=UPI00031DD184|nr:hypothetical protein [Nodosilinea nodulosa]
MFNLEGTLLGFIGGNSSRPKAIVLGVEDEQIAITLPKELRPFITRSVSAGDRLRCIGSTQVDFQAGVIRLKSHQVFVLPPVEQESPPVSAVPAQPRASSPGQRLARVPRLADTPFYVRVSRNKGRK